MSAKGQQAVYVCSRVNDTVPRVAVVNWKHDRICGHNVSIWMSGGIAATAGARIQRMKLNGCKPACFTVDKIFIIHKVTKFTWINHAMRPTSPRHVVTSTLRTSLNTKMWYIHLMNDKNVVHMFTSPHHLRKCCYIVRRFIGFSQGLFVQSGPELLISKPPVRSTGDRLSE
jgi:hypothetical protein